MSRKQAATPELTISDAIDFYLREHVEPKLGYASARSIRALAENLRAFFGAMRPADVGDEESEMYALYRKKQGRKPGTIRRELGLLRSAVNHNVRRKRLSADDKVQLTLPKAPKSRNLWLFPDELAQLRAAAKGRAADFIEIAYWLASRRGVVEQLQWSRISLAQGIVDFHSHGEVETNKRRPIVRISPPLLPTLQRLHATRTNDWVLGSNASIAGAFQKAARDAGLARLPARDGRPAGNLSPHVLRHSRATHLLQDGVSPWAVAGLVGDTVDVVLQVYGHHCPSFMDEIIQVDTRASAFLE